MVGFELNRGVVSGDCVCYASHARQTERARLDMTQLISVRLFTFYTFFSNRVTLAKFLLDCLFHPPYLVAKNSRHW